MTPTQSQRSRVWLLGQRDTDKTSWTCCCHGHWNCVSCGWAGCSLRLIRETILEGTEEGELTTPTDTAEKGASLLGVRGCQVYAGRWMLWSLEHCFGSKEFTLFEWDAVSLVRFPHVSTGHVHIIVKGNNDPEQVLPWLRSLVTGHSPRRPGFDNRTVHVTFVVDEVPRRKNFLPVLQFSPVSIIPPLFHTHSFIYHPHYIMFFSQYFSFPLSVSFHHCSIFIHSSTTHTV